MAMSGIGGVGDGGKKEWFGQPPLDRSSKVSDVPALEEGKCFTWDQLRGDSLQLKDIFSDRETRDACRRINPQSKALATKEAQQTLSAERSKRLMPFFRDAPVDVGTGGDVFWVTREFVKWKIKNDPLWAERTHCYTQWTAPTTDPGHVHPESPALTKELIKEFNRISELTDRLQEFVECQLPIWGMEMDNEACTVNPTRDCGEKFFWLSGSGHNLCRISRVFDCLSTFNVFKSGEETCGPNHWVVKGIWNVLTSQEQFEKLKELAQEKYEQSDRSSGGRCNMFLHSVHNHWLPILEKNDLGGNWQCSLPLPKDAPLY